MGRQLAKSVVSPENPLSVRVFVNRIWMHHFDERWCGLQTTLGDGEKPTHPELLIGLEVGFRAGRLGEAPSSLDYAFCHLSLQQHSSEKGLKTDADNRLGG